MIQPANRKELKINTVRVRVKQEGEINERFESGEITVDGIVSVAVADRERRWLLSAIRAPVGANLDVPARVATIEEDAQSKQGQIPLVPAAGLVGCALRCAKRA